MSVVLTLFVGAHNLLDVGHHGWPVEALLKCVSDQGLWCGIERIKMPKMGVNWANSKFSCNN